MTLNDKVRALLLRVEAEKEARELLDQGGTE